MKKLAIWVSIAILTSAFGSCIGKPENSGKIAIDEKHITIAAVGDTLMHRGVHLSADKLIDSSIRDPYLRVASGFEALFEEVKNHITKANIAFANLETPLAEGLTRERYNDESGRPLCKEMEVDPGKLYDDRAYSITPGKYRFNTHPAFALALKNMGFDIVSTANNHATYRASNGIDKTIDALREADLDYVGTLKYDEIVDEDKDGYPDNIPYVIKEAKGIRIAFFAWTSPLNGFGGQSAAPDKYHQVYSIISSSLDRGIDSAVFNYLIDMLFNINKLSELDLWNYVEWIKKAKEDKSIDLIVVSSHFGLENINEPSPFQKDIAHILFEAGADIVLGGHPHVIQPMERYITSDGRETFVIYSLGNFIAEWGKEPSINPLTSVILYIGVSKTPDGTFVKDVDYIPIFSYKRSGTIKVVPVDKYPELSECRNLIEKVFSGDRTARLQITMKYFLEDPSDVFMHQGDLFWEIYAIVRIRGPLAFRPICNLVTVGGFGGFGGFVTVKTYAIESPS